MPDKIKEVVSIYIAFAGVAIILLILTGVISFGNERFCNTTTVGGIESPCTRETNNEIEYSTDGQTIKEVYDLYKRYGYRGRRNE